MALNSLPDLVLASILSHTDNSDSKNLLVCCKRLRDLTLAHKAVALIVPIPGSHATSSPGSPRGRQRARTLTHEELHRLSRVTAQCSSLARLRLFGIEPGGKHMDAQVARVLGSCMLQSAAQDTGDTSQGSDMAQTQLLNVTHVTLQGMCLPTLLPTRHEWVPNLQHLTLSSVDIHPDVHSHTLPTPTFQHLQTITVDKSCEMRCLPLTAQHVRQQLAGLPALHSLHMYKGDGWGMHRYLRNSFLPSLQVIAHQLVCFTCNDSTPLCHWLHTDFPRLQQLTLLANTLGDAEVNAVLVYLPALSQLSVQGFDELKHDYSGRVCAWRRLGMLRLKVQQLLQLPLSSVRQLYVCKMVELACLRTDAALQHQLQQTAAALKVAEACGGLKAPTHPCTHPGCTTPCKPHQVVKLHSPSQEKSEELLLATVPLLTAFQALHLCLWPLSLQLLKGLGHLQNCTYLNVQGCSIRLQQVNTLMGCMLGCLPHVRVLEGAETLCTQVQQLEALLKSVMRPITLRLQLAELDRLYVEDGHATDGFDERLLDAFIQQQTTHPELISVVIE